MVLYNPSAHCKVLTGIAGGTVAAGATVTLGTEIDATAFEYVAAFISVGVTGATLNVKFQGSAAAGGAKTDIDDPANTSELVYTATDDDKVGALEARIRSKKFLTMEFVAGAGTDVTELGVIVVGFTPQYGEDAGGEDSPDFNTLVLQNTLV